MDQDQSIMSSRPAERLLWSRSLDSKVRVLNLSHEIRGSVVSLSIMYLHLLALFELLIGTMPILI